MRAKRRISFGDFYGDLQNEAQANGPGAMADLRAKEVKYALINALITRRHDLSLSQEGLSAQSGVAQTEISKIERGRKSPTIETFSRLVSALRIDVLPLPTGLRAQGMSVFTIRNGPAESQGLAATPGWALADATISETGTARAMKLKDSRQSRTSRLAANRRRKSRQ